MAERKVLKESTMSKWKETFLWLKLTEEKDLWSLLFLERKSNGNTSNKFSCTIGCTNLKLPALRDHQKSGHKQAVK